jgi:hypothetical protein
VISDDTPIIEEAECCQKCGSDEQVGLWWSIPICVRCHDDKIGFAEWFARRAEQSLENDPDYFKDACGRWVKK